MAPRAGAREVRCFHNIHTLSWYSASKSKHIFGKHQSPPDLKNVADPIYDFQIWTRCIG